MASPSTHDKAFRGGSWSWFAAALFFACSLSPSRVRSQDPTPQTAPAPQPDTAQADAAPVPEMAPPPADFKNPIPSAQLAFLRDYADKSSNEI